MTTLAIENPELVERLKLFATIKNTTANSLLQTATNDYLDKIAAQKIKDESIAYQSMYAELVPDYLGKYVAIHKGKLVDSDKHVRELHLRIRKRFGRMPVLLRQVTAAGSAPPELVFRSPRLEPIVP